MVLKKSNSCLNSGATQRVTGGKVVARHNISINPLHLLSLSIRLHSRPLGKKERPLSETVTSGLRLLEDYLGWEGPSRFQNVLAKEPGRVFSGLPMLVHCGIESNKTWHVHQRLKTMMSDLEFLRDLSSYASVEVEETRIRPAGFRDAQRRKRWTSAEAMVPSSNPSAPKVTARDVRLAKNFGHARGIQRPHMWREDQGRMKTLFNEQRTGGNKGLALQNTSEYLKLSFSAHTCQRADARWANSNYLQRKKRNRITRRQNPLNSLNKLKSCKGSEKRWCQESSVDFLRRIVFYTGEYDIDAESDDFYTEEHDVYAESDVCYTGEYDTDAESDVCYTEEHDVYAESDDYLIWPERERLRQFGPESQDEESMEENSSTDELSRAERLCSLNDFITSHARNTEKRKGRKKIRRRENATKLNELSPQGHCYFPKGSYTYVSRQEAFSFLETSPEVVLSLEIPTEDEKVDAAGSPDGGYFSDVSWFQTQSALEQEADAMRADFTHVLLQESEDDLGLFLRSISSSSQPLPRDHEMLIVDKRTIHIGRTQPPCFLVQLQPNDADEDSDNPACLVVKGHASSEKNSASLWSVNIGADISAEHSKILNHEFHTSLANSPPDGIHLNSLINAASEALTQFWGQSSKLLTKAPALGLPLRKTATKNDISSKLQAKSNACFACVSVKEACTLLTAETSREIVEENEMQQRQEFEMVPSPECEVCLLPSDSVGFLQLSACGHSFCVACWGSHVLRLLQDGASQVLCMASGCSNEVNKAELSTLVPYRLVCRWAERVRDKFIETHPSCKWCPRQGCQRLAVLVQGDNSSLPGQVSDTVTCPCGNTWCFGCQGDLHWPASCDQMAAYNHFRSHLDSTSAKGFGRVIDFVIELKPCPMCRYPIEKNKGCPSMVCRMCWTNFCWNCLQVVSSTHNVYECTGSESYTTYRLTNRLANDLPIRYYHESVQMDNKFSKICSRKVQMWFESLQNAANIRKSSRSRQDRDVEALRLATESLDFLKNSYVFLECFFLLLSFAYQNKTEISRAFVGTLIKKVSTVEFITGRLDTIVISKSRSQILTSRSTVRMLLVQGQRQLSHLVRHVTYLQGITEKVETEWIKKLDPKKYMRYK